MRRLLPVSIDPAVLEIELVLRNILRATIVTTAMLQYRFAATLIGIILGAGAYAPMMIKVGIIHAEDLIANGDASLGQLLGRPVRSVTRVGFHIVSRCPRELTRTCPLRNQFLYIYIYMYVYRSARARARVRVYVFGEIGKSYPIRGVVSLSIHDVSLDRFRTISINGDLNRMQTNRTTVGCIGCHRLSSAERSTRRWQAFSLFLDRIDSGYASFSMFRRTEAKMSSLAVGIQLTFTFLVGTQGYSWYTKSWIRQEQRESMYPT